jgi:DNA invertase Pin-like site-specific DNA recombinase
VLPFAKSSKRIERQRAAAAAETREVTNVLEYARISKNPDGTVTGVERQQDENHPWAEGQGWNIVGTLADDDTSAYALGRKRPNFEEALRLLNQGELDDGTPVHGIIAWKIDRLTRSASDWARLVPKGGETPWFVATKQDNINTSKGAGRVIAGILVVLANAESSSLGERARAKHDELARKGKPSGGGTRGFGHDEDGKRSRPDEKEIVAEIAIRILAEQPLGAIAADLNRRGIRTPSFKRNEIEHPEGGLWSAPTIRRLMISPRLVGRRMLLDGQNLSEQTEIEPLIGDDLWRQMQARLDHNANTSGPGQGGTKRKHLLSGFLRCSQCGATLRPWKSRGWPAFSCLQKPGQGGCGKTSLINDGLDDLAREIAIDYLERYDLSAHRPAQTGASVDLLRVIEEDQAALDELTQDRYDRRTIGVREYEAARRPIVSRIEANRRKVTRADAPRSYAGPDVGAKWDEANRSGDLATMRAILGAAVDHFVVLPGFVARPARADGLPDLRGRRRLAPKARLRPVLRPF